MKKQNKRIHSGTKVYQKRCLQRAHRVTLSLYQIQAHTNTHAYKTRQNQEQQTQHLPMPKTPVGQNKQKTQTNAQDVQTKERNGVPPWNGQRHQVTGELKPVLWCT